MTMPTIAIEKSALSSALALVRDVVERRNTIPILSNVRITPGENGIVATLTNLDIEVTVRVDARVAAGFAGFTVSATTLQDIVAKLPDGPIGIDDTDGRSVVVKAGKSRFKLQTLPVEDFPTMSGGREMVAFEVGGAALAEALTGVRFAISTEETRYYLNGVFCHRTDAGRLALVATDGHRLARRVIDIGALPEFPGVIVPRQAVTVLCKYLAKSQMVTVEIGPEKIRVAAGDTVITSKLIDGTFPDYVRVIPREAAHDIGIDVAALGEALDRVMVVGGERGRMVRFDFTQNSLHLAVSNPDAGNAEEDIDVDGAAEMSIGFNGQYLAEALARVGTDPIRIHLSDPGSPATLRAPTRPDDLIVLMPMRI